MKRLRNYQIGVDQGDVLLHSDFENGGPMWTGTGPRVARRAVRFSTPFLDLPSVHVSLSLWDADAGTNARMEVVAERIAPEGFDLVFRTWADSRVARVRLAWLAIGELPHEDDWQIS